MYTAKTLIAAGLVASLAATPVAARNHHSSHRPAMISVDDSGRHWNRTSFDLDNGTVVITHRERRQKTVVEFTEDRELYIDGEVVKLDASQEALVGEFYDNCLDLYDSAKKVGWEGAKIGLGGAKLGFHAIGCVFKLLSPNYDSDDMERELQREADKLEARAEALEDKAEKIEEQANDLDDLARDLKREIPALGELDWF